jgi:hypothetical protein
MAVYLVKVREVLSRRYREVEQTTLAVEAESPEAARAAVAAAMDGPLDLTEWESEVVGDPECVGCDTAEGPAIHSVEEAAAGVAADF